MTGVARWMAAGAALIVANLGGMIVMIMDGPHLMSPLDELVYHAVIVGWFAVWGFVVALMTPRLWQLGVLAGASGLYLAFYAVAVAGVGAAIWDVAGSLGGALIGAILYKEASERLS